ncbi:MAG: hypothetical protein COC12_01615 [Rhodobacteraceae bacterium]|nr:MAG: hypothetical protein COC12_01615 [Paracoccaceae bacterium]
MKQKIVGYIRVSTPRQADDGISLDEQGHMLRGYCDDKKLELLTIEEDDCTAAGAEGHVHRPGLRRAIQIAKEQSAAILVPSVDRLARHLGVLQELFENDVPVISVAERRRVGRKTLERLIGNAQRDHNEIARRAREGMARAKARGVKLGNPTNLDVAQRNGAISNIVRADRKTQELADFLKHTPGWEKMILRELVEIVNRSGPHNLVSEKRNERRPWTAGSIRKPLEKAKHEITRRREIESGDLTTVLEWPLLDFQVADDADHNQQAVSVADADEEYVPVSIAYKDHPGFGMFGSLVRNGSSSLLGPTGQHVSKSKS